jgi:hypothetical protein
MPLVTALALLALLWATAAPAQAAEPKAPLFAALGIETVDGRQGAVAAPLSDGRVLIAGGSDNSTLRSAEIFDPVEIAFEPVPNLTRYARSGAVAAPLPDGRVLIAGGANEFLYAHAEVFDPETEEFSDVEDEMTTGRIDAVAAPLPGGRVLIAGGYAEGETLNSAEVFDPLTETFSALNATMWSQRSGAVGVDLSNGKVLITGGSGEKVAVRRTEVFDPLTESFSMLHSGAPNETGSAVGAALADGQVLIAGGISGGIPRRWSGLLDPGSGGFSFMPKGGGTQLSTERADAIAVRLPDGKVLISGGSWPEARSSAEIFVPPAALRGVGGEFGDRVIGDESAPVTVVVTSRGGWRLEIDAVSLGGADAADFSILADNCSGANLMFGETCTLSVRLTPSRLGEARAFLDFDDSEPTPTPVPLSATGVAPFVPGLPVVDRPAAPDPRFATSVRCAAKPLAGARRAKVTCRFSPAPGAWEARLLHAGRTLVRRRTEGGPQRLTFKSVRCLHGPYRLQLVALP